MGSQQHGWETFSQLLSRFSLSVKLKQVSGRKGCICEPSACSRLVDRPAAPVVRMPWIQWRCLAYTVKRKETRQVSSASCQASMEKLAESTYRAWVYSNTSHRRPVHHLPRTRHLSMQLGVCEQGFEQTQRKCPNRFRIRRGLGTPRRRTGKFSQTLQREIHVPPLLLRQLLQPLGRRILAWSDQLVTKVSASACSVDLVSRGQPADPWHR